MAEEHIPGEKGSDRASRLGRPPLPPDQARSERVVSFVMPDEFGALKDLAAARGVSLSAVIHQILSSALTEKNEVDQ